MNQKKTMVAMLLAQAISGNAMEIARAASSAMWDMGLEETPSEYSIYTKEDAV